MIGPNCPGVALARQGERRDHPGRGLRGGLDRARLPLGHADLPDRLRAGPARARQLDDRRHRRRPVVGSTFVDILDRFEADPETELIVLVGEIGGDEEEKAARHIAEHDDRSPSFAYIAGFSAPPGKTMGHAGAIISGSSGTAQAQEGGARGGRHRRRHDADRGRRARRPTSTRPADDRASGATGHAPRSRSRSPAACPRPSACPRRSSPTARATVLERDGKTILSYGSGAGYTPLRELIGEWFKVRPGTR